MRKNLPPYILILIGVIILASGYVVQNTFFDMLRIFGVVLVVVGLIGMIKKKSKK